MNFREFSEYINGSRLFSRTFEGAESGERLTLTGLTGSSVSFLVNGTAVSCGGQVIVITPDYKTLETLQGDLEVITGGDVNHFPAYRGLHLEDKPINKDIRLSRLTCLQNLSSGIPGVYLIEARSLFQPIMSPDTFRSKLVELNVGSDTDFTGLIRTLSEHGFQRETMVADFGQMSVRGGILDIFSPSMLEPVRIEFDYDTIDSIRVFDINDQRSVRHIDSITVVPPVQDMIPGRRPCTPEPLSSILDYFDENVPVFFHQPVRAHKALADYIDHWGLEFDDVPADDEIPVAGSLFRELKKRLRARPSAYIRNTFSASKKTVTLNFGMKTLPRFNRNIKMFARYTSDLQNSHPGLTAGILCDNPGQSDRLKDIILDEGMLVSDYFVDVGTLSEGFVYPGGGALLINDHEIFSRKHFRKPKHIYRARRILLDELSLKIGDFVVHEDYGIGRYLGLKKIRIGSSDQEALKIQYRDGDSLFLNIEKLPRLEKYTGQEGHQPELSKLGGTDWARLKKRTKRSVRNIAGDLLEIYSKRESTPGYAFSPDTQWQRELEASFHYDETSDQMRACWDIKKDMESPRPMDRLVCGDVGFGKTEVALRAAFKAVNDGKQAAILVPTTILAQQHYETFKERLEAYPVKVEMLSRFRTRKEQQEIAAGIKQGTVDVVVGTHRLLSKDILFKDLGLLIIDEEQRFGVTHKEKLKQLRAEVDVMTLTATPIPRTMHMAVLGVRDLSTISTPPKNRLPIITEISEYDEQLIRAAIMKELDRGGQIYFVHNRVQTIHKMASKLEKIVPEAMYGIAHGQMKERELEQVMFSFLRGDFDCLVSTMIIESGLDIPSVNTIIINQADNFGLAQLYQLRGRVGRSDKQAFAYLLTPPFVKMSDVAISRLQTLTEHTELGSGLQVALKDLEIRGAGNLLGAEQSGHINDVGFDMYTKLVKESVSEQLRETLPDQEEVPEPLAGDVKLDADISAYLPDDYIPDEFQRVSIYRKLASVENTEQLENLSSEIRDRFGPPPEFARNLITLMHIKTQAASLLMKRVQVNGSIFTGTFLIDSEATAQQKEQLARLVSSFVEKSSFVFRLKQGDRLKIELPLPDTSTEGKLMTILDFFKSIGKEG